MRVAVLDDVGVPLGVGIVSGDAVGESGSGVDSLAVGSRIGSVGLDFRSRLGRDLRGSAGHRLGNRSCVGRRGNRLRDG